MAEPTAIESAERKSNSELRRLVVQLRERNRELTELLLWLGPRIRRRNANGAESERFCLCCTLGQPQYKRLPCRHSEIWALAARDDQLVTEQPDAG